MERRWTWEVTWGGGGDWGGRGDGGNPLFLLHPHALFVSMIHFPSTSPPSPSSPISPLPSPPPSFPLHSASLRLHPLVLFPHLPSRTPRPSPPHAPLSSASVSPSTSPSTHPPSVSLSLSLSACIKIKIWYPGVHIYFKTHIQFILLLST